VPSPLAPKSITLSIPFVSAAGLTEDCPYAGATIAEAANAVPAVTNFRLEKFEGFIVPVFLDD
jgi:hypothetical protein